ncbi:MAG TPA: cysteine dioxygenase family protein [Solirubrobacteraceae bacterium]|nr:cysteine dioxygenase family protein [Solirubrobacteraceae bacterium]
MASLTLLDLEQFVAGLAASPERWRHAVRHASDVRVFVQIWDDEDVNAWVICWSHDQDTGFHDHDESTAAIAVVDGQVREDRLRLDGPPRSRVIGPGSIFTVPATAIHRVLHAGDAPAVTIHAYSPPLHRTGAYRVGPGGELEREPLSSEDELRATPAVS